MACLYNTDGRSACPVDISSTCKLEDNGKAIPIASTRYFESDLERLRKEVNIEASHTIITAVHIFIMLEEYLVVCRLKMVPHPHIQRDQIHNTFSSPTRIESFLHVIGIEKCHSSMPETCSEAPTGDHGRAVRNRGTSGARRRRPEPRLRVYQVGLALLKIPSGRAAARANFLICLRGFVGTTFVGSGRPWFVRRGVFTMSETGRAGMCVLYPSSKCTQQSDLSSRQDSVLGLRLQRPDNWEWGASISVCCISPARPKGMMSYSYGYSTRPVTD